jgi:hypothetical protein
VHLDRALQDCFQDCRLLQILHQTQQPAPNGHDTFLLVSPKTTTQPHHYSQIKYYYITKYQDPLPDS